MALDANGSISELPRNTCPKSQGHRQTKSEAQAAADILLPGPAPRRIVDLEGACLEASMPEGSNMLEDLMNL